MGAVKTLRVAVTGGRDHVITPKERQAFLRVLREWHYKYLPANVVVIHGACKGADIEAARIAEQMGYATVPVPAPWETMKKLLGEEDQRWKAAGHIRNWQLVAGADLLIAFPGGSGTADCIRRAEAAGVPVLRIEADAPRPD